MGQSANLKVMAKATEAGEHPTLHLRGELMGNSRDIVRVWGLMKILGLLLRCVELFVAAVGHGKLGPLKF